MDDNSVNYLVQLILSRSHKKCVNNTRKKDYYRGTFTSDDLVGNSHLKFNIASTSKSRNFLFCFVVNTLTHEAVYMGQVEHWLAIAIRYNKCKNTLFVIFFYSFAKPYSDYKHVKCYMERVKSTCALHHVKFKCDSLTVAMQDAFSKLCGVYVCRAVAQVWESTKTNQYQICGDGVKLKHMFSTFGRNRKDNDLKMIRYLHKEWTSDHCHNTPFPWKVLPIEKLINAPAPPAFCPKKTLDLPKCRMGKCKCRNLNVEI